MAKKKTVRRAAGKRVGKSFVEEAILDVVLKEVRRAMRLRSQTEIIIDPWVGGGGAYVFASTNEPGHSYEIAFDGARPYRRSA